MLQDFDFTQDTEEETVQYQNDDYINLGRIWINERCAPEILPYQESLVNNLREMLEAQVDLRNLPM